MINRLEFVVNDPDDIELCAENKKKLPLLIEMLLKNEYEIKLWSDDLCVCIECSLNPSVMGGPHLEWIDDEDELLQNSN